jgi:hypothetical protein
MLICICGVGMIWLTRTWLWIWNAVTDDLMHMHAYTHILKNQFWVCSKSIESCSKFLIPFSAMWYPGSPQQKAAAEVHHVSNAQHPRERCIRSMIPLRTKCSATRPRPAPRATSIELHESTTDPAEVAAMRRNIPAGCPISTRDPLPGLSTDIPIIVLSSSDDKARIRYH